MSISQYEKCESQMQNVSAFCSDMGCVDGIMGKCDGLWGGVMFNAYVDCLQYISTTCPLFF